MINTKSSASVILITAMLLIVGYLSMTTGLSSAPIFTQQSDLATSTAPTNVAPTIAPTVTQSGLQEPATLIGGRVWHGPASPTDPAEPTMTAEQREEFRRFARNLAICTEEEARDFVSNKLGDIDLVFGIAQRSTKDQILRWLKGQPQSAPSTETTSVLWVVGILASQPLTEAQYLGWMFPSSDPIDGKSTGIRDAVYVFTEDGAAVMVDRARHVQRTVSQEHEPLADEEYIDALQAIGGLPEVPSQIEAFPDLDGLCLTTRQ